MMRFRSSRKVQDIAEHLFSTLQAKTNAVHGVGYRNNKGYQIIIYHSKLPTGFEKVSEWYGYPVIWERAKPEPAV